MHVTNSSLKGTLQHHVHWVSLSLRWCGRTIETSAKNMEGTYEDISMEKMTFRRPKNLSNHPHFKKLGMSQCTRDANPSVAHKCASQTCENNIGN